MRRVMGSVPVLVLALASEPELAPPLPHAAKEETMASASSIDVSFFFIFLPPKNVCVLSVDPPERQITLLPDLQVLLVDLVPDLSLQFHEAGVALGALIAGIGD